MSPVLFGVVAGLTIGFLIPLVKINGPEWALGAAVGLLISLPDAVITRAYAPIITVGLIGGAAIGWASNRWVV